MNDCSACGGWSDLPPSFGTSVGERIQVGALLEGRDDDTFGVGWYYIGISDEFGPVLANTIDDGQGVEMYYEIALTEAFRLSLDLQVIDPNIVTADTAVVPSIRARIEF